jgi:cytolysin (calcineurin-like family phosphatase)
MNSAKISTREGLMMQTVDRACIDMNYEWFRENLPILVKKYDDQYVVVKDKSFVAAYPSFNEAFDETLKTEKPGTFIIQLCSLDESKTTIKFYSRARFDFNAVN